MPEETPTPPAAAILIVDDEAVIRDLATMALSRCGYQVECASTAAEAMAQFQSRDGGFAAVVVDKNLAGSCGEELLEGLRRVAPDLPAVLISGDILRSSLDGRTAYLGKPFRLAELGDSLGAVMEPTAD